MSVLICLTTSVLLAKKMSYKMFLSYSKFGILSEAVLNHVYSLTVSNYCKKKARSWFQHTKMGKIKCGELIDFQVNANWILWFFLKWKII